MAARKKSTTRVPLRVRQMAALYKQDMTMEQVARKLRISRESVRYGLHRYYPEIVRPRGRKRPDERRKLVLSRAKVARSWSDLANATRLSVQSVRDIVREAGVLRSTTVRFAEVREAERREELLYSLRRAAKKLGYTPTASSCSRHVYNLPTVKTFYRYFGSLRKAQRAAGLLPNKSARPTPALLAA